MIGYQAIYALLYSALGVSIVVPLVSMFTGRTSRVLTALAWIGLGLFTAATALTMVKSSGGQLGLYGGLVVHDAFTTTILLGEAVAAAIAILAAGREPLLWESSPAFFSLLPLALVGSYYIIGATDALLVLAAWLLVSVISYVVVALPSERDSRAAAVRYILVGAVATIFLGLWVAATAVVAAEKAQLGFSVTTLGTGSTASLAFAALLAALGFKIGLVPFHWWLPSVYGRANGLVIGVVSGVVKLAFIGLAARLVYLMAGSNVQAAVVMAVALAVVAVATMTYGNIAALTTGTLKGLLAYSSIAHVGYIAAALAALAYYTPLDPGIVRTALAGIALQAAAYGVAKAALFPLAEYAETLGEARGMLSSDKAAGVSAGILLMSLLGMPPLLGFWGKLYMFLAVAAYSPILVAVALVNSAISSAYYVRAARELVAPGEAKAPPSRVSLALLIATLATVLLGIVAPLIAGLVPVI